MKVDSTPSQVATSALQAIPFASIIGAPLDACIKAQAMAAQTTWQFIQEVGMQKKDINGDKEAINVAFTFIQNGNTVRLNIPLLSIVPIPYIAIQNIDISFKANLSAASSAVEERSSNDQFNVDVKGGGRLGWGIFSVGLALQGGYSSKKDSRATQDSKYSVEYTMDVGIRAGQESMPAGLAKVLEILNSSLNVTPPEGILGVNDRFFIIEKKEGESNYTPIQLIVTYRNPDGLYDPSAISVSSKEKKSTEAEALSFVQGNSKIFMLDTPNTYIVSAGKLEEEIVVKKTDELTK